MPLEDNEDYQILVEAVRDMAKEYSFVGHFIMHPDDAEDAGFPLQTDDLTGEDFIDVEGYRVYMNDTCPLGQIGACVPEDGIGQA